MKAKFALAMLLLGAVAAVGQQAAQPKIEKTSAPYTSPASGKLMFNTYCASCHGAGAKGNGPAAAAVKGGVPDLTMLAKSHGGKYPMHVYEVIKGDTLVPAHGSVDMPVWGPVLTRVSEGSNAELQQRLNNLTAYIGSLQQK